MEMWLTPIAGFDDFNHRATVYGTGHQKVSWLSFYDVARFALMCIDNADARNATFELGGPEALTPLDASGFSNKLPAVPSRSPLCQSRHCRTNRYLERIPGRVQSQVCGDASALGDQPGPPAHQNPGAS
jgi:hypothetical protein